MRTTWSFPFIVFLTSIALINAKPGSDKPTEIHGGNGITLPPPPSTDAKPVTDNIAGQSIADPYRWLEDSKSPETRAWIATQMSYTEGYLSQIKIRPQIVKRLTEIERVESFGFPHERNGIYFFSKRLPDENQASIYMRKGLHGDDQRLIDATKLSADQNTSVAIWDLSEDSGLMVYTAREGGADEQTVHVFDVNARKDLPESLPKARYSGISLSPDKLGLYYSKTDPTGSEVFYHRFKTPTSDDPLIFGKRFHDDTLGPMDLISAEVTENGRHLLAWRAGNPRRHLRKGSERPRFAYPHTGSRH